MAYRSLRPAHGYLHSLLVGGVTSSVSDGQLLERFADRRDEGDELAFAALVQRHGPAALRVVARSWVTSTSPKMHFRRPSWCWQGKAVRFGSAILWGLGYIESPASQRAGRRRT